MRNFGLPRNIREAYESGDEVDRLENCLAEVPLARAAHNPLSRKRRLICSRCQSLRTSTRSDSRIGVIPAPFSHRSRSRSRRELHWVWMRVTWLSVYPLWGKSTLKKKKHLRLMDGLVRKCDCRLRWVKYGLSKTIIKKKNASCEGSFIFIISNLCSFYYVSPATPEVLRYMRSLYYLNIVV